MKFDTETAAGHAAEKLDSLLARAQRDSAEVIQSNDIPTTVTHYAAFRDRVKDLAAKVAQLQKHADTLSYEILPTMFGNQNVKTITVEGVGRVTINVRWTATMLDKQKSMEWLKETGNGGIVIETVNAMTLSSFAKSMASEGMPLPEELFRVGTAQHVSITNANNGGLNERD